jgi:hypothetical protein
MTNVAIYPGGFQIVRMWSIQLFGVDLVVAINALQFAVEPHSPAMI